MLAVLLLWSAAIQAADVLSRDVDLQEFGRFEIKSTGFAENQRAAYGADDVATQIENLLRSKVKDWNAQKILRGDRAQNIQPYIERFRIKDGSALALNSHITLRLRLTDASPISARPLTALEAPFAAVFVARHLSCGGRSSEAAGQ